MAEGVSTPGGAKRLKLPPLSPGSSPAALKRLMAGSKVRVAGELGSEGRGWSPRDRRQPTGGCRRQRWAPGCTNLITPSLPYEQVFLQQQGIPFVATRSKIWRAGVERAGGQLTQVLKASAALRCVGC